MNPHHERVSAVQLAGACSNPEVGGELRRLAKFAATIQRGNGSRQPFARERAQPRPGWVREVVVAVLADAEAPLRPHEVIRRAERLHGHPIAPSSIRNCLREDANRTDGAIERLGYGRYRLRP